MQTIIVQYRVRKNMRNSSGKIIRQIEFSRDVDYTEFLLRTYYERVEKISSNQLFSNFLSKTIGFTKFLRKKCEKEFLQFPHCGE